MLKYGFVSSLVLGLFIAQASFVMAMEKDDEKNKDKTELHTKKKKPQKNPQANPGQDFISPLLFDLKGVIFNFLGDERYFTFKLTCKSLYKTAQELEKRAGFSLQEKPVELIEQLKNFISEDKKEIHLNALLPVLFRATHRPISQWLYQASMTYYNKKVHLFSTLDEDLKKWQPYGLALYLSEILGNAEAFKEREKLKKNKTEFLKTHQDKISLHLLPYIRMTKPLNLIFLDSYKLGYRFLYLKGELYFRELEKAFYLKQPLQERFINDAALFTATAPSFCSSSPWLLEVVYYTSSITSASHLLSPGNNQNRKILLFFHEAGIQHCENGIQLLEKVIGNNRKKLFSLIRKNDPSDILTPLQENERLNNFFKIFLGNTDNAYAVAISYTQDPLQKKQWQLGKQGLLKKKSNQQKAEASVANALFKKTALVLKNSLSCSQLLENHSPEQLLEKAQNYKELAIFLKNPSEKEALLLEIGGIYEKWGSRFAVAKIYETLFWDCQDKTKKFGYGYKAAVNFRNTAQAVYMFVDTLPYSDEDEKTQKIISTVLSLLQKRSPAIDRLRNPNNVDIFIALAKYSNEKANLYLEIASLLKEINKWGEAAENSYNAAIHLKNKSEKAKAFLEAGFLYEEQIKWNEDREIKGRSWEYKAEQIRATISYLSAFVYTKSLKKKALWKEKASSSAQKVEDTPENRAVLKEAIAWAKKNGENGLAQALENLFSTLFPKK